MIYSFWKRKGFIREQAYHISKDFKQQVKHTKKHFNIIFVFIFFFY